jgi:putative alpha-1,2-mannosidase
VFHFERHADSIRKPRPFRNLILNDDVAEMSSWYLFRALGMYPELPGSDVLVLNSPLLTKAVLHLKNGHVTLVGQGAGKVAPYVQRLTVNGRSRSKPWIRCSDISSGGLLVYGLSSAPNTHWGANSADPPPSYTEGTDQTTSSR